MIRVVSLVLLASLSFQPVSASQLLVEMEQSSSPAEVFTRLICSSDTFDFEKALNSIYLLKGEIKKRFGVEPDLHTVVDQAIQALTDSGVFSSDQIETARAFYIQLIEVKSETYSGIFHSHSAKKKRKHENKKPELMLPDNLAIGFMCVFGGALLCILPFGFTQGLGSGLILTGVGYGIQGAKEGEKPYYRDSETNARTEIFDQ